MNWPTAAGVGGVSVAVVTITLLIAWLVRTCLTLGTEANESRSAQLDAEHFKREAEDQRDGAIARAAKAEQEREALREELAVARQAAASVIEKRQHELKEQIDAGKDDDLVALSRRVFGNALSKAGRAGEPAAPDSGAEAGPVPPG